MCYFSVQDNEEQGGRKTYCKSTTKNNTTLTELRKELHCVTCYKLSHSPSTSLSGTTLHPGDAFLSCQATDKTSYSSHAHLLVIYSEYLKALTLTRKCSNDRLKAVMRLWVFMSELFMPTNLVQDIRKSRRFIRLQVFNRTSKVYHTAQSFTLFDPT